MADQEMEGQDFSEDVTGENFQVSAMENGDGMANEESNEAGNTPGGANDSGAADAPGRDDDRKLFVGGLSWETTEKELREYFSKHGDIESINVKTDPNTGRSRGFAFIVFNIPEAIDKVINAGDHVINGKKVDPKKAKARHGKIFVGGLKPDLSDDDIKNYFGQFGNIIEVEMPFDKQKNQRKGFCFITFEHETVVTDLLKTPKQKINGHEVDVKKATPKPDAMSMMRGGIRGAVRGGRGSSQVRGRGRGWGNGWNHSGYSGYGQSGYGGYGGYGAYDYSYGGYGGYGGYSGYNDYYGYGSGGYGYGPYQAAKGTTARANVGGSRRGTNHIEGGRREYNNAWNGTVN